MSEAYTEFFGNAKELGFKEALRRRDAPYADRTGDARADSVVRLNIRGANSQLQDGAMREAGYCDAMTESEMIMRTVLPDHVEHPVVKALFGKGLDGDGHKYIYAGDTPQR
jgi:hypothetical protein